MRKKNMTIIIIFKENRPFNSVEFRGAKGFKAGISVLTVFDESDSEEMFDLSDIESIFVRPEVEYVSIN